MIIIRIQHQHQSIMRGPFPPIFIQKILVTTSPYHLIRWLNGRASTWVDEWSYQKCLAYTHICHFRNQIGGYTTRASMQEKMCQTETTYLLLTKVAGPIFFIFFLANSLPDWFGWISIKILFFPCIDMSRASLPNHNKLVIQYRIVVLKNMVEGGPTKHNRPFLPRMARRVLPTILVIYISKTRQQSSSSECAVCIQQTSLFITR